MSSIFLFLQKIYVVLFFIIIEGVALNYYVNGQGESQSQLLSYISYITGGVNKTKSSIGGYFSLPQQNKELIDRVAQLESELNRDNYMLPPRVEIDSLTQERIDSYNEYKFIPARVISNSINKANNFITINAGRRDGVREDMALMTPSGEMVGYISGCSEYYAVAISVLSRSFRSSGKLKDDNYFGSLWWKGDNRYTLRLSELSKYANLQQGDTIVSTGFSQIFPAGITIGRVSEFELDALGNSYEVDVELAADLSALNNVIVVGREDVLY